LSAELEIRPIAADEIEPAVRIFIEAFRDNVALVYGEEPKPDAMIDVWTFAREVEPGGFIAARDDVGLSGYALFSSSVGKLERRAMLSGRVILWALRALSGRYGVRWRNLARQVWNKILFVGQSGNFRTKGDAQLLNIAVAAAARGRGVAKMLLHAGMRYLAERDVEEVRLEVMPDNDAAIAAYRRSGFTEKGRLRNVHGEWLVMTANPQEVSP
jgi:ribosomal protein S18 acetylase RimI-like enzyme